MRLGKGVGRCEDRRIPVLPDWFEADLAKVSRHLGGGAVISDVELARGRCFARACVARHRGCFISDFYSFSAEREMDIVSAFSRVTAWLCMTSSANARNAQREQGIPEVPWFPRAQHISNLGKANPEGTERLDKLRVAER